MIIFGLATYAFALKMARLMIFLGPTAPILSAVAIGRVTQWVFAPFRYLMHKDAALEGNANEEMMIAPTDEVNTNQQQYRQAKSCSGADATPAGALCTWIYNKLVLVDIDMIFSRKMISMLCL